eukprot:TRINITY_DN4145_c0_g1_i2.p1 TRINITY_DN4145_c0_g1~~TRINITY_DN4145_c0_g1_i2.p1  ORF type:complete len:480 (+),score=164.72 TRINITY_DN4145_c0_g1_i2:91-1440(+)
MAPPRGSSIQRVVAEEMPRRAKSEATEESDGLPEDLNSPSCETSKFPTWSREEIIHWNRMNEQFVEDVHIEFFYRPHTVLLMAVIMVTLLYMGLNEPSDIDLYHRVIRGLGACLFVFIAFSVVALPNGPFVRPHPAVWRIVLGVSILYWLLLVFVLFQTRSDVRDAIVWLSNEVNIPYTSPEDSPEYAADCDFTVSNLASRVDVFCLAHLLGWVGKALMLRSVWLCWLISISWEITEVVFSGLLPNFSECWWDQVIYDVLVCNAGGILIGSMLCRQLECRSYNWESLTDVPTLTGKVKRAALQFTPQEWTKVEWEPFTSRRRTLSTLAVCFGVLLTELSTFFLKHVLQIPTKHPFNIFRLVIWFTFGMPALRQFYLYVTDKRVKRLGIQSWVTCGVLTTELMICVKFGKSFFKREEAMRATLAWIVVTVTCVGSGLVIAEVCLGAPRQG